MRESQWFRLTGTDLYKICYELLYFYNIKADGCKYYQFLAYFAFLKEILGHTNYRGSQSANFDETWFEHYAFGAHPNQILYSVIQ